MAKSNVLPLQPPTKAETLLDAIVEASSPVAFDTLMVSITPELAAKILADHNEGNRNIFPTAVERYVGLIARGAWVAETESIDFDNDGNLIDGQNRLTAIVQAGHAVDNVVRWGVDQRARMTKDMGVARVPAHGLAIRGFKNVSALAAIAKLAYHYENSRLASINAPDSQIGHDELANFIVANPGLEDAASFISSAHVCTRLRLLPTSIGGFIYYFAAKTRTPDAARAFFERLASADDTSPRSVTRILRERLHHNRHTSKAKLPNKELIALCIKTWNAYATKRPVGTLRWRSEGNVPEAFPEFV